MSSHPEQDTPPVIDVATAFTRVEGLGAGEMVALIVKYSQTPQEVAAHRKLFQEARKRGRFAPLLVPLRADKWGGSFVSILPLQAGMDEKRCRWMLTGDEVRGLSVQGDKTLLAFANALRLVEIASGKTLHTITHPRFKNVHSVEFSPREPGVALVCNTGFDEILEVDLETGGLVWQWRAWEHGYDRNPIGYRLQAAGTPAPAGALLLPQAEARLRMEREEAPPPGQDWCIAVEMDHVPHPLGLEKWLKSAEPNWAGYGPRGEVLASFFVANQAVVIDRASGASRVVLDNLSRPHAMVPFPGGFLVSDTRKGHCVTLDHDFALAARHDFSGFAAMADSPSGSDEWLQFSSPVGDGSLIASVDSARATLILWDPQGKRYSLYPFDPTWSVQSVLPFPVV